MRWRTVSDTRRPGAIAAGALAVALILSGCSDDGPGGREEPGAVSPAALKNCGKVFGERNVEALRADLGKDFQPHDRSLGEMKERMLVEAQLWNPATDKLARTSFHPCQIEGRADGKEAWVIATVGWSKYGVAFMTEGKHAREFREVAKGVYLDLRQGTDGARTLVMPCAVPGTRAGQGENLPLQVSLTDTDRTARTVSTDQLLKALAESTRELLGCAEKVTVPEKPLS
ncbi:hypothetical protein SVEN_2695 [Streptomyces venezuelae ATCC 10712]|uniref:Lipoprotein n=1 Tax=Streptomyces venezuelae (strain ATCC 10712 / CBS 650.69 / DSM 40230 / JCM 4526 / NBRC 13096 / PD 04745) TaxID=953739 RepID=F2R4W0_STRVP|nr:hypothetical protein vnz_13215 [Streptomyces venezuelae]CCA55981.1 hypothetical protein SVEN_2695 [Streptomyces venezuelae ATCC 10712]